jgi:flagellar hook-associated protein 1 FlgK
MTARLRTASSRLNDLKQGTTSQLKDALSAVNSLTGRIAVANEVIARAQGSGQSPIDLLDQRDQLISELNKYIQTSSVAANDGTVNIFVAGSQPLVLGTAARPLSLSTDEFGDPAKTKLVLKNY